MHGSVRRISRLIKRSPLARPARAVRHVWHRVRYVLAPPQARRHAMSGPVGHLEVWEKKRDFQFQFLRSSGLQPHHHLLELGCGTLRGGLPIIEFLLEGHYWGIDVRPVALEEAQKELAEAGLGDKRPELILTGDLSAVKLGRTFELIWAFSVLPHLEDGILRSAFGCVKRHLDEEGRFLATAGIGPPRRKQWMEFPDLARPFEFYAGEAGRHGLHAKDLGVLSNLGHPPNVVNAHHHMLLFTHGG
jgi:SAM-dependent methyltransferase